MFDLDFGKLVVIGIIALIVIGPKELPAVLRTVGQYVTKIRRMAAEFQGQFQEAMREAEMADMKKHMDEINQAAKGLTSSFDPMADIPTKTAENKPAEDKPAATPPAAVSEQPAAVEVAVPLPEPVGPPSAQNQSAQDLVLDSAPQPPAGSASTEASPGSDAPQAGGHPA
jgi:sec-independent protein translocase protein TatB